MNVTKDIYYKGEPDEKGANKLSNHKSKIGVQTLRAAEYSEMTNLNRYHVHPVLTCL